MAGRNNTASHPGKSYAPGAKTFRISRQVVPRERLSHISSLRLRGPCPACGKVVVITLRGNFVTHGCDS